MSEIFFNFFAFAAKITDVQPRRRQCLSATSPAAMTRSSKHGPTVGGRRRTARCAGADGIERPRFDRLRASIAGRAI
jgi:hypothetical protein